MSLRRRIEEAFLLQFADNERLLAAARSGECDPEIVEKCEALRVVLKPIVTDIVAERYEPARG
ncbi:MAG: hypothetical protein K8S25_16435 [Alphaproteobacteria bacterium]|nr:hypothetical protein [Alphaproteobacteria bacterium]